MKALIIDRVSPLMAEELEKSGFEVVTDILPGRERLMKEIKKYDILVMRVDPAIDSEIMNAAEGRLRMIAVCSVGTNHIDLNHAKKLGIRVQNALGLSNNAVAELTLSKMLDIYRHTAVANAQVKADYGWNKYKYNGHELRGHTVGIVGFGNIGARVGQLCSAFGMHVLAYDPFLTAENCKERGAEKVELNDLLERCDILSLHMPLTDATAGMIGEKEIAKLKHGAVIINMARGGILDEAAAARALKTGHLYGVGIDVVKDEISAGGLSDDARCSSPLIEQENCIVTPHIGACTYEASDAIAMYMLGEIKSTFGC